MELKYDLFVKKYVVLVLILLIVGCEGTRKSDSKDETFITVDVTKNYPQKDLILQDFMDVEYITLETTDEFITQGQVLDIGKEFIVLRNEISDGDIFIFERNGKGLRKFNRLGQGGGDYTSISGIVLDEDNGEIFVNDHPYVHRIPVYDMFGKFKRVLNHKEGELYVQINNYDDDKLICRHNDVNGRDYQTFSIISKRNGSTVKEIQIPVYSEKKSTTVRITSQGDGVIILGLRHLYPAMIPDHNDWVLVEHSSDTIYKYLSDNSLYPFIVRVPSIQSMSPEVFLFPGIFTERYYFMQNLKKGNDEGYTSTELVYDKEEKNIFKSTVYNDDYTNKSTFSMYSLNANSEVAFWRKLEAYQLVEAYEKGELKGKLKEIAAGLEEESNPVIMLVKYKK